MFRVVLLAAMTAASTVPALAGSSVVPAVGSPVPVAVAIGVAALALRLFRR